VGGVVPVVEVPVGGVVPVVVFLVGLILKSSLRILCIYELLYLQFGLSTGSLY
jgi:hypothetical protein